MNKADTIAKMLEETRCCEKPEHDPDKIVMSIKRGPLLLIQRALDEAVEISDLCEVPMIIVAGMMQQYVHELHVRMAQVKNEKNRQESVTGMLEMLKALIPTPETPDGTDTIPDPSSPATH